MNIYKVSLTVNGVLHNITLREKSEFYAVDKAITAKTEDSGVNEWYNFIGPVPNIKLVSVNFVREA